MRHCALIPPAALIVTSSNKVANSVERHQSTWKRHPMICVCNCKCPRVTATNTFCQLFVLPALSSHSLCSSSLSHKIQNGLPPEITENKIIFFFSLPFVWRFFLCNVSSSRQVNLDYLEIVQLSSCLHKLLVYWLRLETTFSQKT